MPCILIHKGPLPNTKAACAQDAWKAQRRGSFHTFEGVRVEALAPALEPPNVTLLVGVLSPVGPMSLSKGESPRGMEGHVTMEAEPGVTCLVTDHICSNLQKMGDGG